MYASSPVAIVTANAVNGNAQPAITYSYVNAATETVRMSYHSKGALPASCSTRDAEEDMRGEVTTSTQSITYGGTTYNLNNVHFHAPAEHSFNGTYEPIEAHLVHINNSATPKYVVIVVYIYSTGAGGWTDYDKIISDPPVVTPPLNECQPAEDRLDVNPRNLLPVDISASAVTYRYEGSLTTSPYSGPVAFVIFPPSAGRTIQSGYRDDYIGIWSGLANGNAKPVTGAAHTLYKKPWP
nr:carbonic anhydrase family protein [Rhizohabitans arisaemae]